MKRRDFLSAMGLGVGAVLAPHSLWSSAPRDYRRSVAPTDRHFVERWSWAMGQPVHLQIFAESAERGYAAASAALAELRRVEQHLSLFDDASDLAELNRRAGKPYARFGPDLQIVLEAAVRFQRSTAGAFNPAVEPLMRAWGFHTPRSREPSARELEEAKAAVQSARIILERDHVLLPEPSTRLDLGGIGVGYGLDRAIAMLRRMGIRNAFLDISGDCFALGSPPGETEGWEVQIADPRPNHPPTATLRLRDCALATSANTRSVVHYGRIVRGHVMDPATGWPADILTQVSVVAHSGIEADALSTAMLVSGKPGEGVLRHFTA